MKLALLGLLVNAAVLPAAADAAVRATPLATFSQPVYVAAPPEDPQRVFVVEKGGTIRMLRDGAKVATPFLDITSLVRSQGYEEGLLSLAFAPDYGTSGRFYVYYTTRPAGDEVVVDEFRRSSASPDQADPASRRRILTVPHRGAANHNGGQIMFGPDGFLWVTTGDGGSGNDPDNSAQNPSSLTGKLIRVDPANPRPIIHARGLRNPFRASFDRATGDLTIADVGQSRAEEVNFMPRGTGAGANYGWRCFEGFQRTANSCTAAQAAGHVPPVLEKDRSTGFCAIIGGYVVRDPALRELNGRYVYGDNCAAGLRSAVLAQPRARDDRPVGLSINGLSSFGEDSCGHIYATSLSNGTVYRLDGDGPPAPCDAGVAGPPAVKVNRRSAQRVRRQKGVFVAVRCNEACGFTASARMRVSGSKRRYALRRVSRLVTANQRARFRLRLYSKGLRALRRKGRRARVTVTIVARDGAGNATRRKVGIRAKR